MNLYFFPNIKTKQKKKGKIMTIDIFISSQEFISHLSSLEIYYDNFLDMSKKTF